MFFRKTLCKTYVYLSKCEVFFSPDPIHSSSCFCVRPLPHKGTHYITWNSILISSSSFSSIWHWLRGKHTQRRECDRTRQGLCATAACFTCIWSWSPYWTAVFCVLSSVLLPVWRRRGTLRRSSKRIYTHLDWPWRTPECLCTKAETHNTHSMSVLSKCSHTTSVHLSCCF